MKKTKFSLKDNHGMTLIEVLTAITLLTIFLGCILPLLVSTTRNIVTVGETVKKSYASNSIMQKLLGNIGSNVGYTANVDNIPLNFKIGTKELKTQKLNSITGNTLFSGSKGPGSGYSTFVADSVTTSMYCYPSHIADDFIEKDISLIATGFKFEDISKTVVYWTNELGLLQKVPETYTDSEGNQRKSYTIEIDRFDAKVANFTIKADNKFINYEHSPIVIQYGYSTPILANKLLSALMAPDSEGFSKRVIVEVDAPSMIMVGEDAKNNVYYVTDGIIDDTGDLKIVRKTMGGQNSKSIPLSSAMNDVQWIPAGDGDDPQTGKPNQFGYYAMCGDNAQIRRFLRSPVSGNYYWGGDNTIDYTYHATTNALTPVETFRKRDFNTLEGTTVDAKYAISIDPGGSGR
ncbi:MAG: prepilin-type N-terminal cleavage/methylation domain-containing protein, partial [Oscillospiraceae bacterium]